MCHSQSFLKSTLPKPPRDTKPINPPNNKVDYIIIGAGGINFGDRMIRHIPLVAISPLWPTISAKLIALSDATSMIRLDENDQKAWDWIAENLSICSHEHVFSRKLWARFATYRGPVVAFNLGIVDLSQLSSYMNSWGPLPRDKTTIDDYPEEEWPETQINQFIADYLKSSDHAVVVIENANASRKMYKNWQWGALPPYWYYGDEEVYHILTPSDIGTDNIYNAIRQSFVNWGVGVCATCKTIPEKSITDDSFFDEIVSNTRHIFLPADDGCAFLIWTPQPKPNDP